MPAYQVWVDCSRSPKLIEQSFEFIVKTNDGYVVATDHTLRRFNRDWTLDWTTQFAKQFGTYCLLFYNDDKILVFKRDKIEIYDEVTGSIIDIKDSTCIISEAVVDPSFGNIVAGAIDGSRLLVLNPGTLAVERVIQTNEFRRFQLDSEGRLYTFAGDAVYILWSTRLIALTFNYFN
jgi:hypothetical protein